MAIGKNRKSGERSFLLSSFLLYFFLFTHPSPTPSNCLSHPLPSPYTLSLLSASFFLCAFSFPFWYNKETFDGKDHGLEQEVGTVKRGGDTRRKFTTGG